LKYNQAKEKHEINYELYTLGSISKTDMVNSEREEENLEISLDEAKNAYAMLKNELITEYKFKIDTANKKIRHAQEDLQYYQKNRIIDGKSEKQVELKVNTVKESINKIKSISTSEGVIRSPWDGTVGGVYINRFDTYSGMDILLTIIPENEPLYIMLDISKHLSEVFEIDRECNITTKSSSIDGVINSARYINGCNYLVIAPQKALRVNTESYINVTNVKFVYMGDFCTMIVPNSAFIAENELFALKKRNSFWGEELFAFKQQVQTGYYNEQYTQITSGLSANDEVIINWDREISDGITVMRPLD
jgi:hypothetical protein